MPSSVQLLIIDPQNDFCDLPAAWCPHAAPALPVPGAHADMQRTAALIRAAGDALTEITLTLDSHHRIDIAHPTFWRRRDASPVPPFTAITAAQVRAGEFAPRAPAALPRVLSYLDALEAAGRYSLMVWPVHCEIGSWGQAVHADVRAAYNAWEEGSLRSVRKISKGANPWTEHYSAVQAEVPDADDPHTRPDPGLLAALDRADLLLIAGEAGSHCVRATTEHLAEQLPRGDCARFVLLTDCMSPVAGFETRQAEFFERMRARGARLLSAREALAQLSSSVH